MTKECFKDMKTINFLVSTVVLLAFSLTGMAQERKFPFNGNLTDFHGKAIKKARIYITSPKRYVTCTKLGDFGLTNVDTSDTLKIAVADSLFKVPIDKRRSLKICLNPQTGEMISSEDTELFNKGFDHVSRRERNLGTIISGEAIRRSGRGNLFDALKGRVPGLNITNDGRPGGDSEVNIRGIKSLTLSSTPLFVVDGIITESINDISIYDIDYVEILKEAHIYGSRGANGAILVFTKLP